MSLLLALCLSVEAWAAGERVLLFAQCGPVGLFVAVQDGDQLGLTADAVKEIASTRLEKAMLYEPPPNLVAGLLKIHVLVGRDRNPMYAYRVWFEKRQLDRFTGIDHWSPTGWIEFRFGLHAGNPHHVLSSVAEAVDKFVEAYLRVNAVECRDGRA